MNIIDLYKSNSSSPSLIFALGILLIVGLGCGSGTPPPSGYVGVWQGEDGSTITIRADGGGDYKSGSTTITGGGVAVDETAKTLKITMASLGPSFTIDKAPVGDKMTLSGVVYKKTGGGGSDTSTSDVKPVIPSDEKLQTLVKSTFFDFGDAVQSGDFGDFHKKTAKVWRDSSTEDEMLTAFQDFVDDKENYNFKKAIASLDATLTPAPTIEKVSGVDALIVKGHYPTKPQQANFELKYTMDDGTWKLIGIKIKTTSN